MYAIVRSGGRQYRAEEGALIDVELLPEEEINNTIVLDEVLLVVDGDETKVGRPLVEGASVTAAVVDRFKGKKIIVWKYIPRERYRRKKGHRQQYTRLRIDKINA